MIPRADITAWRATAPWPDDAQVEQDLLLSRALIAMFQHPIVRKQAAFRGGTALHKLFFDPPGRYSEDIDLVQRVGGPIGTLVDTIREALDPWLGPPKWKRGQGRFTLYYRFHSSIPPVVRMRLKIEINTREHFSVLGLQERDHSVSNPWFSGRARITTYSLAELIGTKLRALYQRKKGRDLFDLWLALTQHDLDADAVVRCFTDYMSFVDGAATRAQFEANMDAKLTDPSFLSDVTPLLRPELNYDVDSASELVQEALLCRLPGDPWKGNP